MTTSAKPRSFSNRPNAGTHKHPVSPVLARTSALLPALLLLTGCGKEVGRVPFSSEGSHSASLALSAGKVSFWTDLDIDYREPSVLRYDVTLTQGGAPVATATCDPLGPLSLQVAWVEVSVGTGHRKRGHGEMQCSAVLPKSGLTEVAATLAFAAGSAPRNLRKADLVLKQ